MKADAGGRSAGERRLVLVVGIGRSGTSLFAGILNRLGFHVPKPEVRADDTNPRGFSEPRWVVDFHSRIMRTKRVTVFDSRPEAWAILQEAAQDERLAAELRSWLEVQFVGTENIVIKDPRIGWFLPLWVRCAEELEARTGFATALRYPPEVVSSARTSYGTWQTDASRAAAWLNHTLETEHATRGAPRVFLRYPDLLEDWAREIARVGKTLDLPRLAEVDGSPVPEVEQLVDPSLRRSTVGWDDVDVPARLAALAEEVWTSASSLAGPDGESPKAQAELDGHRAAYAELYADAEAIAQSTLTAVKPRGRKSARPGGMSKSAAADIPLKLQIARRIPRRYRDRLRFLAHGRLHKRVLGGLGGVVRLVPPRYRERVPIPVVRAGSRFLRSLRR